MFNNMQLLYNPLQAISSRPQRANLVSQRDLVERILNIENGDLNFILYVPFLIISFI